MMSDPADQLGAYRKLKQDHDQLQRENAALKAGGGGGTSPPMADDHLTKRVDGLQTLVYSLVAVIVAGFIAIFGAVIVSSNTTNTRIDGSSSTVSVLNREVGVVSTKMDESNKRLDRIDQKLDQISAKLDK